jgi:P-type Ca2+ transporter type 2C
MVAPPHLASLDSGLTEAEAAARLQSEGANELPAARPRSLFATAWKILREPMILLLVGAGAVYLFLGELRDSSVLLASIFVVIGISLYQERKTHCRLCAIFPALVRWSSVTVSRGALLDAKWSEEMLCCSRKETASRLMA